MEIEKVLVLSTGHVSHATADKLEDQTDDVPVVYTKGGYGWWVLVPEAPYGVQGAQTWEPATCPADLSAVLALARAHGCKWVCLDQDGETVADLPVYEW